MAKPARKGGQFPSLKAKQLLAVLQREPLSYKVARQSGSHRRLEAPGRPSFSFARNLGEADPAVELDLSRRLGRRIDDAQLVKRREDDSGSGSELGLGYLDHRRATGPQLQHSATSTGGRVIDRLGQLDDVESGDLADNSRHRAAQGRVVIL